MALEDVGVNLVVKGGNAFNAAMARAQAAGVAMGMAIYNSAIAAGKAILSFSKDSIAAASDLNETLNKTRVIFGDASKYIEDFAKTAANSLGLSEKAAMDAAGTFAIFFKGAGMSSKGAASFSTNMVKLSADLASFYNTSPEDAILALGAALRGESEPIRRYGVLLDDASLRQKALKLGIVKTTKEALTPQQRVLAAYQLIMEQTSVAQGDFANTSEGLANQQRILAANLENVKAKMGQALLPVVNSVILAFNKFLVSSRFQDILDGISKRVGELARGFGLMQQMMEAGNVKGGILTMLNSIFGPRILGPAGKLVDILGKVKEGFGKLFKSFKEGGFAGLAATFADLAGQIIVSLTTGLLTNQAKMLDFGLKIINGISAALVTALPNLIPVVVTLLNSIVMFITQTLPTLLPIGLQIIMTIVDAILAQLPSIFRTAVELLVTLANGIANAIPQLIPAVVAIIPQIITTLINNLPALITAAIQIIMALADGLIKSLPVLIAALPQIVATIVKQLIVLAPQLLQSAVALIGMLLKGIVTMLPKIGQAAGDIIGILVKGIGNLASKLWDVGKSIVEGVWKGISGAWDWFWGQIKGFFSNIIDGVKKALGIPNSPSKVFTDIGTDMGLGIGFGFQKSMRQVSNGINKTIKGMTAQASISMASMPGIGAGAVNAGPITNNYSTSYNLQVMTNQNPQVVQQSFSIMRMLAG